jgi:beta-glucosidase
MDAAAPIEARVNDLVARMTLPEKISQMVHGAPAIERLGVPAYNRWNEGLHGVARAGIATVFPQAIGLAATWNSALMFDVATVVSDEARAKHHEFLRHGVREIYTGLTYWSPNINIFRDPRWGRGHETYGECPHLTARMGVAFVKGMQGDDPQYLKLVATAKHYAVHSGPESLRHSFDARVSERDLRLTYLPAFEALIREAGAYSVMGAYNRTNGEACNASPTLLEKILRQEWGFQGYVVSDCWAIKDIYKTHGICKTVEEAAALAVKAGCDINCGEAFGALLIAERKGLISEAEIDRSVKRLFTARMKLGMFDPPTKVRYAQIPYAVNDSAQHRALALRAARESIVLLKNANGLLPLAKSVKSIAVIGPNADDRQPLLGNYNGTPSHAVTPLEGIRRKVEATGTVYSARGSGLVEGVPAMRVIPTANLRPLGGSAGQTGLSGAYYRAAGFEGKAERTQVDAVVDFQWQGVSPLSGKVFDPFAVRWTGFLIPPTSGTYHLGCTGYSSYRLWLDGELVVEYEGVHHNIQRHKAVELEAGRLYGIQLDYVNTGPAPEIQLLWSPPGADDLGEALDAASHADVVVAVLGMSQDIEGEEMPVHVPGFDGGDRTDLNLPRVQEELLQRVHALGKPVILVLLNGSALAINWAAENVPAIIEAWYPGEEGGTAIADVIFGDYNPGGRLPVTFYTSVNDLPPFTDYDMEGHTYRYFRGKPLYAFGHGLSYTTFAYSNLRLSTAEIAAGKPLRVQVDVANTGKRAGDEVLQLYISDVTASAPVPLRDLVGFTRLHLARGEKKTVTFEITARQMSLIDDAGRRVVEPGEFVVSVGGRQPRTGEREDGSDILFGRFMVTGKTMKVE